MIFVYGKKGCQHCEDAKLLLDEYGYKYIYYDMSLKENREQRKLYRDSNWELIPIIQFDNGITLQGKLNKDILKEIGYERTERTR